MNRIPKTNNPPFTLSLINVCMDGYGNILHLPMGDYRSQSSFELGRKELRLMKFTKRVQNICSKATDKRTTEDMSLLRGFANV